MCLLVKMIMEIMLMYGSGDCGNSFWVWCCWESPKDAVGVQECAMLLLYGGDGGGDCVCLFFVLLGGCNAQVRYVWYVVGIDDWRQYDKFLLIGRKYCNEENESCKHLLLVSIKFQSPSLPLPSFLLSAFPSLFSIATRVYPLSFCLTSDVQPRSLYHF